MVLALCVLAIASVVLFGHITEPDHVVHVTRRGDSQAETVLGSAHGLAETSGQSATSQELARPSSPSPSPKSPPPPSPPPPLPSSPLLPPPPHPAMPSSAGQTVWMVEVSADLTSRLVPAVELVALSAESRRLCPFGHEFDANRTRACLCVPGALSAPGLTHDEHCLYPLVEACIIDASLSWFFVCDGTLKPGERYKSHQLVPQTCVAACMRLLVPLHGSMRSANVFVDDDLSPAQRALMLRTADNPAELRARLRIICWWGPDGEHDAPHNIALGLPGGCRHAEVSLPLVALDKCAGSCSYRGWCIQNEQDAAPQCLCKPHFQGAACANTEFTWHSCLVEPVRNGLPCGPTGKCVGGVCLCAGGIRDGYACHLSWPSFALAQQAKARAAAQQRLGGKALPLIYIYDMEYAFWPEFLGRWLHQIAAEWGSRSEGSAFFLRELLVSEFRTLDPEQATYFIIPVIAGGRDMISHEDVVQHLIDRDLPWVLRRNLTDHVWGGISTFDASPTEMLLTSRRIGDGRLLTRTSMLMHFGGHVEAPSSNWDSPERFRSSNIPSWLGHMFLPGVDIVVPSYHWHEPVNKALRVLNVSSPESLPPAGGHFAFFAGSIRNDTNGFTIELGNTRLLLQSLFGNLPGYYISSYVPGGTTGLEAATRKARFCFGFPGVGGGWGVRGDVAIVSECVPVFVNSERALALEELLPYKSFALLISRPAIANLPERLSSVTDDEVRAMRRELSCLTRLFHWLNGDSAIVEAVLMILRDRALYPDRLRARQFPLDPSIKSVCGDILPRFSDSRAIESWQWTERLDK